ncbi:putative transcription factor SSXT family [Helianthus anomalus]
MQQQLMQQHTGAFNTTSVTTDHIQQYLDENKALILNILENQSTGKFSECAE